MDALRPTTTHRVRAFLCSQGVDLRPWSGLDQTYGELYALLAKRRDDPAFWEPLAALLHDVLRDVGDRESHERLPAPGAELLRARDVDDLVRSMRAALPGGDQPKDPSTVSCFTTRLSSAAMACFLVLGLAAAGCVGSGDPDVDWDGRCGSAVLQQTLEQSDLSEYGQEQLCACFTRLNESWVDGLEDLFEHGSAEEIATALDELAQCWDNNPQVLDCDYDVAESQLMDRSLCSELEPQPAYKGVSFLGR